MTATLKLFGWLCIPLGGCLMLLDVVQAFVRLELARTPNVGTGLLLMTTGLIAIHLAHEEKK